MLRALSAFKYVTGTTNTSSSYYRKLALSMSSSSTISPASADRAADLAANLDDIRHRVREASSSRTDAEPLLVAVSKYKPSSDILACYELGQRDFGENYVQELVDKAKELPQDIRWHFIGTLQTNKSKILASIPNLHTIQTLSSIKAAEAVNKALSADRDSSPLNILLQVNTSGEESKSGLPPLSEESAADSELVVVARHIIEKCLRLRLQGLMTIGSLTESLSQTDENHDFETLKRTRDVLEHHLKNGLPQADNWGQNGRILMSMGMSSDFEVALRAGSDIVRVGTGIFGERHKRGEDS